MRDDPPEVFLDNSIDPYHLRAPAVAQTVIAGGAAGDHTVDGIQFPASAQQFGDALVSVIYLSFTGSAFADLTSEFQITATDTINNGGGTNTSDGFLMVTYAPLQRVRS